MAATSQIKEHMEVLGSDGVHVGTVDHLADDKMVKLTHTDSPDGKHHYLALDLVDHVDEHVHLNVTAEEAAEEWEDEDEDEEVELDQDPASFGEAGADEEDSEEWAKERR
jgi:hypothetical protein